jgi:glucosamine kinase
MMTKQLIADAGGSKTAWGYIENGKLVNVFETSSLHPRYVETFDANQFSELKNQLTAYIDADLIFYGAGCSSSNRKEQMTEFLLRLGFVSPLVLPDTLGSCRAALGNKPGFVAILGTGSVLMQYDGVTIQRIIGGLGAIIGDEGSGMNFGKLVVKGIMEDQIPFTSRLENILESKSAIQQQLSGSNVLPWLSSLSKKLEYVDLTEVHLKNFNSFYQTHLNQLTTNTKIIHVTGTYGFKQQSNLKAVLNENDWELGEIIEQPLNRLIEYHISLID